MLDFERVKGNLNAEGYIDLLGNAMIPSMHFYLFLTIVYFNKIMPLAILLTLFRSG